MPLPPRERLPLSSPPLPPPNLYLMTIHLRLYANKHKTPYKPHTPVLPPCMHAHPTHAPSSLPGYTPHSGEDEGLANARE